jgi:hypothetical protein
MKNLRLNGVYTMRANLPQMSNLTPKFMVSGTRQQHQKGITTSLTITRFLLQLIKTLN